MAALLRIIFDIIIDYDAHYIIFDYRRWAVAAKIAATLIGYAVMYYEAAKRVASQGLATARRAPH